MVPLSKTLFILLNLALLPGVPYLWLTFVFFIDVLNLIILLVSIIAQKIYRPKLALVYRGLFHQLAIMITRAFMELALTPYRAYIAVDASMRTMYRLLISKKNLLRWNTSETVDASIINTLKGYFLTMWSSMLPAVIIIGFLLNWRMHPFGIILYGTLALIWVTAFYFAYVISQPRDKLSDNQSSEENELLLETARRTWQFFKELSTKENNWLCPDNYQMSYVEKITDKTSPTNIGFQFLSILSARDFGFETLTATLDHIENLLNTVVQLPKWKGHLYNWYQINTLEVLNPEYISTVDSGNFLGHLIAMKNGLLELLDTPVLLACVVTELRKYAKLCNPEIKLKESYRTIGDFVEAITDIWEDMSGRKAEQEDNPTIYKNLSEQIDLIVNEVSCFKLKDLSFTECPTLNQLALTDNKKAKVMADRINSLCSRMETIITNTDFSFLYNEKRMLFHIGFHVSSHTLDAGCYDLIASESALTSFMAIARGEVPLRHWYRLGRPLTIVKGIPCFVSWSGTMFEYLMSKLVMKEYSGSVFDETARAAVLQQINYAKQMGIPWGISESQYYRFDLNSNYQYKAFGVPKLRLQPVRKNSLVVAPYATMLALNYAGEECFSNLRRLKEMGAYGEYGYYEAVDFNGPDANELTPYRIVKSFMAHHQGMNLVAINNFLNHGIMQRRFHTEAMVKAAEVLLEEKRHSHLISLARRGYTINVGKMYFREDMYSNRYVNSTSPRIPVVCYLSNNKYSLMITSDGD
ncbi:MAG TPA: glucoamylase family protein, partial [Mobilitalea sp.]|nr:glucoamylase family protein [Mobilitalea sp.]